jgi:hypothetical protein
VAVIPFEQYQGGGFASDGASGTPITPGPASGAMPPELEPEPELEPDEHEAELKVQKVSVGESNAEHENAAAVTKTTPAAQAKRRMLLLIKPPARPESGSLLTAPFCLVSQECR